MAMTLLPRRARSCLSLILLTTALVACSDSETADPIASTSSQSNGTQTGTNGSTTNGTGGSAGNNDSAANTAGSSTAADENVAPITGTTTGTSDGTAPPTQDTDAVNEQPGTTGGNNGDTANTPEQEQPPTSTTGGTAGEDPATDGSGTAGVDNPATDTPNTDVPPTGNPGGDAPGTDNPTTDTPGNDNPGPETPTTDNPGNDNPGPETPTTDNPGNDNPGTEQPEDSDTVPPIATGADVSGNEDDSPTPTESASIPGPFIKDPNRGAGPPSVPDGLTLLMSGENFVEFSWNPSTDDQSVESYEIYRDGALVYTIKHNDTFEFNYRNWISTSYIDCNYTRFTGCEANPIVPGSSYQYQVAAIDNEGMKSALSAPVTFQLAQRQSGGADLTGYVQVLNEEFDGESLDRSLWKTSLPWGPNKIINSEKQYFVNLHGSNPIAANPFVLTGTSLQITGTVTPPELLESANNQPYLSGVISTQDKFKMTYGYIEMNAKLTSGEGFLSTFYLFNQDFFKNKPEIDVIEYIGSRPDKAYQTYHYYDSNRARNADGERHSTPTMETVVGFDLSSDFHKFGVLWEPGLVVWYIDGNEVRRLTGPRVSDEPMNIIAQLVVGSEWIGDPDPSSLPKTLEIDYIKAWQKQ